MEHSVPVVLTQRPIALFFEKTLKIKIMYKIPKFNNTSISQNKAYVADSHLVSMRRILSNKEPIKDASPIVYTERKDGVLPDYDIRTDKMEYAVEAMGQAAKSKLAARKAGIEARTKTEDRKVDTGIIPRASGETQSEGKA